MECFWSAPNIFLAATCCPASILHRAQNCCLVSLYPVWFTVARKLVQMRKGGWMTRQPFMCSRTIRNGRAGSIRKWWWWPHGFGYPSSSSSFQNPLHGKSTSASVDGAFLLRTCSIIKQRLNLNHTQQSLLIFSLCSPRKVWLLVLLTSLLGIGRVMAVQHCDNLVHTVLCLSSVKIDYQIAV